MSFYMRWMFPYKGFCYPKGYEFWAIYFWSENGHCRFCLFWFESLKIEANIVWEWVWETFGLKLGQDMAKTGGTPLPKQLYQTLANFGQLPTIYYPNYMQNNCLIELIDLFYSKENRMWVQANSKSIMDYNFLPVYPDIFLGEGWGGGRGAYMYEPGSNKIQIWTNLCSEWIDCWLTGGHKDGR